MDLDKVILADDKHFDPIQVIELYRVNNWSSAQKPDQLISALKNSHSVVTAHYENQLIGLGNAISDGHLVVYYPHLLVRPEFHGRGIGKLIINKLQIIYEGFHQQMLTADKDAISFYEKCGFSKAGNTQAMWIYDGGDH